MNFSVGIDRRLWKGACYLKCRHADVQILISWGILEDIWLQCSWCWWLADVVIVVRCCFILQRLMPCNCPAQSSLCNLCYHDLLSFAIVCSNILLCKSCALCCLPCFAMPCYALSCVALLLHCLANVVQCLVHVVLCAFVFTASAKEWSRRCWKSYCRLRQVCKQLFDCSSYAPASTQRTWTREHPSRTLSVRQQGDQHVKGI